MTDKQPEALRLADLLERDPSDWGGLTLGWKAAAKLRRLHEVNAELMRLNSELVEALWKLTELYDAMGAPKGPCRIIAEAALAKAEWK